MCAWMCGLAPWWMSGTRAEWPTSRKAGRSAMRVSMGGVPFYGQAEPELRLRAKGAAVPAHVAGADAVHRPERPAERLGRAVAVAHRDPQQVAVAEDVGRGDRHAAPPDVLGQRHAGQRREHPAEVVLGRAETARQPGDVDLLGEVVLDELDEPVEHCDHGFPFRHPACSSTSLAHPTIAVRFDRTSRGHPPWTRSDEANEDGRPGSFPTGRPPRSIDQCTAIRSFAHPIMRVPNTGSTPLPSWPCSCSTTAASWLTSVGCLAVA